MAIAPDIMEKLLVELCRFLIEAADVAREDAPMRTPEVAAYDLTCANAAVETLRHAIATRDREKARNPLQEVAARLGITLDETDPDWRRLAFRALRIMLDAEQENLRRDQGVFDEPSPALKAARSLVDAAPTVSALPFMPRTSLTPPAPCLAQEVAPITDRDLAPSAASTRPFAPTPEDVQQPQVTTKTETAAALSSEPPRAQSSCPTIEKGSDDYIEVRSQGYKTFKPTEQANEKAGNSWARNTAPNVRSTARLLSRILGNKPFDQITDEELKAAWEIVARVPHTYQAKTSKMSPQEAADDADATEAHNAEITRARLKKQGASPGKIESEILKGRIKRLRTATIYRHMQDFQRICVFHKKRGHLAENIMEDHIWETAEYERREILEEDNERQTWCGKLDGLFRSPIFQDKLADVGDPMFWAPLIAVHMGLRSEEVLQLYLDDIQIIDDIPCIVLKQGPGQSLKSKASRRTIPIHDNLLKLGFMQLVAGLARAGEPRLFPWLERSESKKTYTETFSKRFTRYRQDHKIYDAQRDFHSFRTTFNHLLIQSECPDSQRRALMGHVERDVGITNYNPGGFALTLLRKRVNAVVVDISMIRSPFAEISSASVTDLVSRRAKASA
ncbi:tyrosine-type recombinase/integrase [Jannaschia rubra]|nr:tyrosine-type recombinase/integrase [Jannaschia rubra]